MKKEQKKRTYIICEECGASKSCKKVEYEEFIKIKDKFGLVLNKKEKTK